MVDDKIVGSFVVTNINDGCDVCQEKVVGDIVGMIGLSVTDDPLRSARMVGESEEGGEEIVSVDGMELTTPMDGDIVEALIVGTPLHWFEMEGDEVGPLDDDICNDPVGGDNDGAVESIVVGGNVDGPLVSAPVG